MAIVQYGNNNTAALTVPQTLVQILSPKIASLNGVPSNVMGIVGAASWGPVGVPVVFGDYDGLRANFGDAQNRKSDLASTAAIAIQNGANTFVGVRVTDTTDAAAQKVVSLTSVTAMTFTAKYTGVVGNKIAFSFSTGSAANTARAKIFINGVASETYDNLPNTGAAFWPALEDAINNGNRLYAVNQSPSQLVRAAKGTSTTMPTLDGASTLLSGGTDGATGITDTMLLGAVSPATGMYALEGQNVSVMVLADATSTTTWAAQDAFAAKFGIYAIVSGASGESIATAATNKATAAIDDKWTKVLLGDWCWWNDPINGVLRLVSPAPFAAARIANLAPNRSGLNQPIAGIVGTQKAGEPGSGKLGRYSDADLQALAAAGIDAICAPAPAGDFYALRLGVNSSSKAAENGDNHTRMTSFLAKTLDAGMGAYIGEPISPALFNRVTSTLTDFLSNLQTQGILSLQPDGSLPFTVTCNISNNPFSRTSKGYLQADIQVVYAAITRFFILNLEGGQTVVTIKDTK